MVTTNRMLYTAAHKTKVLDRARELGSVAEAAREYGHEPGLVYGWRHVEPGIRKAAKKDAAQADKETARAEKLAEKAAKAVTNGKHGPPPPRGMAVRSDVALSPMVLKKPAPEEAPSPEGPKMTVHALGPWLRDVVKQELPGALDGQVERLIDEKLADLDRRLVEAVRLALKNGVG